MRTPSAGWHSVRDISYVVFVSPVVISINSFVSLVGVVIRMHNVVFYLKRDLLSTFTNINADLFSIYLWQPSSVTSYSDFQISIISRPVSLSFSGTHAYVWTNLCGKRAWIFSNTRLIIGLADEIMDTSCYVVEETCWWRLRVACGHVTMSVALPYCFYIDMTSARHFFTVTFC